MGDAVPDAPVAADSPVTVIPGEIDEPIQETPALCLSGGGYRAMVFHIGVIWRLYEAGLLGKIARISSVSGGSITAAFLGMKWSRIDFTTSDVNHSFIREFVTPLRKFAGNSIDIKSVILGALLPGTVGDRIASAYDAALFEGNTLQALPDAPRFVINATNVQSGVLCRFTRRYMWDYRVGRIDAGKMKVTLAQAVAASSSFPPVLSPFQLQVQHDDFVPGSGMDLQRPPFTTGMVLTDGGVYDNLGLETAWKRHKTVFVSDAGGKTKAEEAPKHDWPRHSYRVLNLIDSQVRALRSRQVIDSLKLSRKESASARARKGALWGIRTDIADFKLHDALPCPHARTMALAEIPTRLKRLDDLTQERLINWGYAICDAALRAYFDPSIRAPVDFPYPAAKV